MLHALAKREGLVINHKRTERIYKEEKLSLTIRRRKKRSSQARVYPELRNAMSYGAWIFCTMHWATGEK
jgi:hypothetical protein